MSTILPEGEDLRRAVKWVSTQLKEECGIPLNKLIQEAIFKFDLSPKDSEFLITFYSKAARDE